MGIKRFSRYLIDPKKLPWGFSNSLRIISTNELIAFYDMDHISGNILLDSYNNNDMLINGAELINGYKNYALSFNSTNAMRSSISLGSNYAVSFRVRQLVKPTALKTEIVVCNENTFAFGYYGDVDSFILKSGITGRTCQIGDFQWGDYWNHILINYTDEVPSIYINNQEPEYSVDNYWSGIDGMYFGGTFVGDAFHGDLDQFRLYNRILQFEERNRLFNER